MKIKINKYIVISFDSACMAYFHNCHVVYIILAINVEIQAMIQASLKVLKSHMVKLSIS